MFFHLSYLFLKHILLNLISSGSFVIVVLPLKSGRICFGGTLVMRFFVAVQLFEKITLLTMHLYSVVFVCFVYVSFIVLFMHHAWLCAMRDGLIFC